MQSLIFKLNTKLLEMVVQVFVNQTPPVIGCHFPKKRMMETGDAGRSLSNLMECGYKLVLFSIKVANLVNEKFFCRGGIFAKWFFTEQTFFQQTTDESEWMFSHLFVADWNLQRYGTMSEHLSGSHFAPLRGAIGG
jgi:hypothetical protein